MSDKEAIDGMKAVAELTAMLKVGATHTAQIVGMIVKSIEGDHIQYFKAVDHATDLNEEDMVSALIVACSAVARIRALTKGTDCYQVIKDILDGGGSATIEQEN